MKRPTALKSEEKCAKHFYEEWPIKETFNDIGDFIIVSKKNTDNLVVLF